MPQKVVKARCSQCGYSAAYTGRTVDEVRRIVCPTCSVGGRQNRLTVYGTDDEKTTPALSAGTGVIPGIERVPMSDAYRQIVNRKSRAILDTVFGPEEEEGE